MKNNDQGKIIVKGARTPKDSKADYGAGA